MNWLQEKLLKAVSARLYMTIAGVILLVRPDYFGAEYVEIYARLGAAALITVLVICDTIRPLEERTVVKIEEKRMEAKMAAMHKPPPTTCLLLLPLLFVGCGYRPEAGDRRLEEEKNPFAAPLSILVTPPATQAKATASMEADGYSWLVLSSDFAPVQVEYADDRRSVLFATESKKRYLLAVTALTDGELSSAQTFYPAEPRPVPPPPGPDPDPPDPPTPVFPDGRFKLAKLAYDLAQEHVAVEYRAQGKAIATECTAVSADIASGKITGWNVALQALNVKTAQYKSGAWGVWFDRFIKEIERLYDAGELSTVQDFGVALDEIATGLRAA
jgi:hypothetical protein